jgi:hypothetical protein
MAQMRRQKGHAYRMETTIQMGGEQKNQGTNAVPACILSISWPTLAKEPRQRLAALAHKSPSTGGRWGAAAPRRRLPPPALRRPG